MTEIEAMRGDVLTTQEMQCRGIRSEQGKRGGMELRAPTYEDLVYTVLLRKGFLDSKHIDAACDYLELKNSVYGFLAMKTMAGILRTGETGLKRQHAESAYYIAAKYIGRTNERIITHAMNDVADRTLDIIEVVNAYRTAFHSVFDGMDLAISEIKNEMQKALA